MCVTCPLFIHDNTSRMWVTPILTLLHTAWRLRTPASALPPTSGRLLLTTSASRAAAPEAIGPSFIISLGAEGWSWGNNHGEHCASAGLLSGLRAGLAVEMSQGKRRHPEGDRKAHV